MPSQIINETVFFFETFFFRLKSLFAATSACPHPIFVQTFFMKQQFRQFLFGTSLNDNKAVNIGWLLFRLHIGLSMAIHAGLPKMKDMAAPGWFNDQVAGLGFTFPSPAFWATVASWGEFVGGLCIALGLLTRFNALQLAFQFFVISFLWYDNPEPITGMYFQNTLFMAFVLAAFFGGGRYSLDKLITNRQKIKIAVPVKAVAAALVLFIGSSSYAQRGPLNGSGNIVTKTFDYKNFDKLEILDIAGTIKVEVGKPFSISIDIDDNLAALFRVNETDGELKIQLEGNEYNKLYLENTNIKITVTMPEVSVVRHRSNADMNITGITGRYFRIKNSGNGTATIKGSIDELDISSGGNGGVKAEEMIAKLVKVEKSGNGDVYIKTDNAFTATGSGNGDVINKGEGLPDKSSGISGNGEIKYKNQPVQKEEPRQRVHVKIQNETAEHIELTIKYPGKGSYGIDVKANSSVKESFPVGTKLYRGGQFTAFKKAVYEVTAESKQTFTIKN